MIWRVEKGGILGWTPSAAASELASSWGIGKGDDLGFKSWRIWRIWKKCRSIGRQRRRINSIRRNSISRITQLPGFI